MNLILLLFSLLIPVFVKGIKKELLVTKNEIVIKTPGVLKGGSHSWLLKGFKGSKVILSCDIIDIPQSQNCQSGRLLVSDGLPQNNQVHCGRKSGTFQETRNGFLHLLLELKDSSGSFKCRAKLESSEPHSDKNFRDVYAIMFSTGTLKGIQTWEFTGMADNMLTLSCELGYKQSGDESCNHDFWLVDSGDGQVKRFCGPKRQEINSTASRLALRLYGTPLSSSKSFSCSAFLSKLKYFKDIPSEEIDSSEFGNGIGTKKTTCDCGRANKRKSRIIYGIDAGENEFPWAVSLEWKKSGNHQCGGSIVSKRHVVSCAHCTPPRTFGKLQIVAGGSHLKKSKHLRRYDVLKIINHDYQKRPTRRDISILITKDEIEFSATVGPICLPDKDPEMVGKYVTAVGWGDMAPSERGKRDKKQLKKTHLRIVDPKWCSKVWRGNQFDTEGKTHICTWSNHTDICTGDSGGPVTWVDPDTNRYFLVGCPSLCDGCSLRLPSLHTAMFAYFKWITGIIAENDHPENVCTKIE